MYRAPNYLDDFRNFVGAAHIISDNESSATSNSHDKTMENTEQTRDINDSKHMLSNNVHNTREATSPTIDKTRDTSPTSHCQPCDIPYDDIYFEPIKSTPISEGFKSDTNLTTSTTDIDMDNTREKQFRLLTIHERLDHISFPILWLLTKCGFIPRDL